MRNPTFLLILVLLLPAFACDDDDAPVEPAPEVPTADDPIADQPEPTPTGELMRDHFLKVREARQAIIGDDLDAARTAMDWLANNEPGYEALPEGLRPQLELMRDKASEFGEATTLTEAGAAFAGMLNHCGGCHDQVEGGPNFAAPPAPEGDELPAQMQRHRWAVERMWEGIVSRNAESYASGAALLGEVQLRAEQLPQGVLSPERINAILDHVKELGAEAEEATEWEERTENFGRLLATCATCHRALGVGAFARTAMEPDGVPEE